MCYMQENKLQFSEVVNCSKPRDCCQKNAVKFERSLQKTEEVKRNRFGKLLRNWDTE